MSKPEKKGKKSLGTQGLKKTYRGRLVVDEVSIDVGPGEIVGLLGPNGAGKTTTFYMVVGLVRPEQGEVFLNSGASKTLLTQLPMHERARLGVGYLAQEASAFRKLTVEENLLAILEMTALSKDEQQARLEQLLAEFHLEHVAKQKAYTLSGGERRRTEVARALVTRPDFLLLDEPFVGIDPIAVLELQKVIRQLKAKGIGILITDHNVRETLSIIDRAYLLAHGKVLMSGTAKALAASKEARKLYLGENFKM